MEREGKRYGGFRTERAAESADNLRKGIRCEDLAGCGLLVLQTRGRKCGDIDVTSLHLAAAKCRPWGYTDLAESPAGGAGGANSNFERNPRGCSF